MAPALRLKMKIVNISTPSPYDSTPYVSRVDDTQRSSFTETAIETLRPAEQQTMTRLSLLALVAGSATSVWIYAELPKTMADQLFLFFSLVGCLTVGAGTRATIAAIICCTFAFAPDLAVTIAGITYLAVWAKAFAVHGLHALTCSPVDLVLAHQLRTGWTASDKLLLALPSIALIACLSISGSLPTSMSRLWLITTTCCGLLALIFILCTLYRKPLLKLHGCLFAWSSWLTYLVNERKDIDRFKSPVGEWPQRFLQTVCLVFVLTPGFSAFLPEVSLPNAYAAYEIPEPLMVAPETRYERHMLAIRQQFKPVDPFTNANLTRFLAWVGIFTVLTLGPVLLMLVVSFIFGGREFADAYEARKEVEEDPVVAHRNATARVQEAFIRLKKEQLEEENQAP